MYAPRKVHEKSEKFISARKKFNACSEPMIDAICKYLGLERSYIWQVAKPSKNSEDLIRMIDRYNTALSEYRTIREIEKDTIDTWDFIHSSDESADRDYLLDDFVEADENLEMARYYGLSNLFYSESNPYSYASDTYEVHRSEMDEVVKKLSRMYNEYEP
jgi:hypothetical protein